MASTCHPTLLQIDEFIRLQIGRQRALEWRIMRDLSSRPLDSRPLDLFDQSYADGPATQALMMASNLAFAPGPRANGLMIGTSIPDSR